MSKYYPIPDEHKTYTPEDAAEITWGRSRATIFSCGEFGPHLGIHAYGEGMNAYVSIPMTRETLAQIRAVVEDAALALDEFESVAHEDKAA